MQSSQRKTPCALPHRILMLGNSLTTANNMPQTLSELTGAQVVVHARGGASLAEQLNPNTRLGAATQAALAAGEFGYVVLQEMSHKPVTNPQAYRNAVDALCAWAHSAKALPVIYATWGYAADCPKLDALGLSYDQMATGMRTAFEEAALENGALLADPGRLFFARGDRQLWAADGVHPSPAGSRLAAECIARACGLLPDDCAECDTMNQN